MNDSLRFCLDEFVQEGLPNLFLVEILKKNNTEVLPLWLDQLMPTLPSQTRSQLGTLLVQMALKFRAEGPSEYTRSIADWLNRAEFAEEWLYRWQFPLRCAERDQQACEKMAIRVAGVFSQAEIERYLAMAHAEGRRITEKDTVDKELEAHSSTHFLLQTEESVVALAEDQFGDLEKALEKIRSRYDWYPAQRVPVVLYDDPRYSGMNDDLSWAEALYDGKIRIPIKAVVDKERFFHIALHEITHAMIDERFPHAPSWFHEGLAQFNEEKSCPEKPDEDLTAEELKLPFLKLETEEKVRRAYQWSFFAVCQWVESKSMGSLWNLFHRDVSLNFEDSFYSEYGESVDSFLAEISR